MDQPPRNQKNNKQQRQRIGVGRVAVKIEAKAAEDRPGVNALHPVGAAGEPARAVGDLLKQQGKSERQHDQGQMAEARDDETRQIAENAGGERRKDEPRQRLAEAPFGQQSRRVSADAEIGGVAERDDAAKAEDQIERQRKQRGDRDLARQHQIGRRENKGQKRRQPEDDLAPVPADLRLQIVARRKRLISHRTLWRMISSEN